MRKTLLAVLAYLCATAAALAQVPNFPQTVPAHSVVGRVGIVGDSGPTQAIPWATLAGNMLQTGTSCPSTIAIFQFFVNTTSDPTADVLTMWDGTQCVTVGTLNRSTHSFSQAVGSGSIDTAFGLTRGSIIERGASAWGIITPGTSGLPFVSNGAGADPAYQALNLSNGVTNVLPVANGGSNGATAASGRAAAGLNIDECTSTGDAAYTILATDRCVYHTTLTAARTDTLPPASSVNAGQVFYLTDFRGVASAINTVTIARSGADTINGSSSVVGISAQFGAAIYWSDGVSRWTFFPVSAGGGGGTVMSAACDGLTITSTGTCPPHFGFANCSLGATVASNNLTVSVLDNTGASPSNTSPCQIWFRNSTAGTGSWQGVTITASTTFTANAGSTFGATNTAATCAAAASCPFRLWVVAVNTGAGVQIGVTDLTNASGIQPLNEAGLLSTTSCNACGTATAIGTTYSTTAQTSRPIQILGYLEWGSGLATAGTYASAPTLIQTMGPGIRKPGEPVQTSYTTTTTPVAQTATSYAFALFAPNFFPTSAVNLVRVTAAGSSAMAAGLNAGTVGLFRGTTNIASQRLTNTSTALVVSPSGLFALDAPGTTSATSYSVKVKGDGVNSASWPSTSDVGNNGVLEIQEIQG